MLKVDYHVHSNWSSDSNITLNSAMEFCEQNQVDEIVFTEHIDPHESNFTYNFSGFQKHIELIRQTALNFPKVNVLCGIEIGVHSRAPLKKLEQTITSLPLDFVIASLHSCPQLHAPLVKMPEKMGIPGFLQEYYDELKRTLENFDAFDVVGHLDYPMRYFPLTEQNLEETEPTISAILKDLGKRGRGIEINSAYVKQLGRPQPPLWVFQLFRSLGGRVVTIGSDAHQENRITANFKIAIELLCEAGFGEFARFRRREISFEPIDVATCL